MILKGQVPPGSALVETDIARRGAVSRTTAREAIRLLAVTGLVRHTPHKGAVVATMSALDVRELYQVRRILEPAAIDVPKQLDAAVLEPVEQAFANLTHAAHRTGEDLVEADLAFHRALVAFAGNRRIDDFYATVVDELRFAFSIITFADEEWLDGGRLVEEHTEFVELLRANKRSECKRALIAHIDQYERRLLHLERKGDDSTTGPAGPAATDPRGPRSPRQQLPVEQPRSRRDGHDW